MTPRKLLQQVDIERSEAELLRFQEDLRGLIGNVKRAAEDG